MDLKKKQQKGHTWLTSDFCSHCKGNNTWWEFKVSLAKKAVSFAYITGQKHISCFIFQLKAAWSAAKPEPTVRTLLPPRWSEFQRAEGTADCGGAVLCLAFWELRAPC